MKLQTSVSSRFTHRCFRAVSRSETTTFTVEYNVKFRGLILTDIKRNICVSENKIQYAQFGDISDIKEAALMCDRVLKPEFLMLFEQKKKKKSNT